MINHYNAFISYKHAPLDNKVAETIHKGLERFKIPGKIKKKTGFKRINRIFRDKDELPITNDLSETIASALENSDYLIVICSENTKESAWVPREIEYFLRNHTKRQVFTVLASGEPYDVIPKELLYEEKTVVDENGNEKTVQVPIEPLSCDFRMPLSKAKKTEIPRLASGLIGCAYDELMNRRRQYVMKRIVAGFSLALCLAVGFCGYMMYSRNKVHQNYVEALRNQSKYLARESENYLAKEQRITALFLALSALPKDEKDDRPVTAEAVRALTSATLSYVSSKEVNINAAWNYEMPNEIVDYAVPNKGDTIAIYDTGNVFGIWNTKTHEKIIYFDELDDEIKGIKYLDDDMLAVWTYHKMTCYKASTGEVIWECNNDENKTFTDNDNMLCGKKYIYIGMSDETINEIDIKTGKITRNIEAFDEDANIATTRCALSPKEDKIAFAGMAEFNKYAYGVIDIKSGKAKVSDTIDETIKAMEWLDNDRFVIATTLIDGSGSSGFSNSQIVSTDENTIRCISAKKLEEEWTSEFECNGVTLANEFVMLGKGDSFAYYSGNVATIYDSKTGEMKYSNNVNDSIVDVSDRDGDGEPIYITENGVYAYPALTVDEDAAYCHNYFTDDIRQIEINNGIYARKNMSHEIIYYGIHVYDEDWTALDDKTVLPDEDTDFCLGEENLAVLTEDNDKLTLYIYGLKEDSKPKEIKLPGKDKYGYKFLCFKDDNVYLSHLNDNEYELVTVSIKDGKVDSEKLFKVVTDYDTAAEEKDGRIFYHCKDEDGQNMIGIYDIESKSETKVKTPGDDALPVFAPKYLKNNDVIYYVGEENYIVDAKSGNAKKVELPESWNVTSFVTLDDSKDRFAISDRKKILILNKEGETLNEIRCPGMDIISMSYIEGIDDLIVLYDDGSLYSYDSNTGEFIRKIEVSSYYLYNANAEFKYDQETKTLYIQMDDLTDVVDMENGVEVARIQGSFGYNKDRDIFLTYAEDGDGLKVGYYKRYTVNDLIDKAHKILRDAKMSDELKSQYGIDDN